MHLFLNSLAATAGGGLTYIRNVIPVLASMPDVRLTVALSPGLRHEFRELGDIGFVECEIPPSRRFWYEQSVLPGVIRKCGADVLLSAGNFALRKSSVPQILLSRNSLYTSRDFSRDLFSRGEYRMWLDTRLKAVIARRSTAWAEATVAPSEAFAIELRKWTRSPRVTAIHHGFDRKAFTADATPLAADVEKKLSEAEGCIKLLFVSHYNYYRNFETLISALPLVRELLPQRSIKLLLTCKLARGENPGAYNPESAAHLVHQLGVSDSVEQLGTIPYNQLHHLYRRADLYVTPAYTESFAHPLVEAMSSGVPIVAADLAVHREICEGAAVYFDRFSPQELAHAIAGVVTSPGRAAQLSARGMERSLAFSWEKHVRELLLLARSITLAGFIPHSTTVVGC
jgi:glycosyltransferase involved in cell wall biosynthesis